MQSQYLYYITLAYCGCLSSTWEAFETSRGSPKRKAWNKRRWEVVQCRWSHSWWIGMHSKWYNPLLVQMSFTPSAQNRDRINHLALTFGTVLYSQCNCNKEQIQQQQQQQQRGKSSILSVQTRNLRFIVKGIAFESIYSAQFNIPFNSPRH